MESEKQRKAVATLLIGIGGLTCGLSSLLLTASSTRDLVRGVGVGILVVGVIIIVVLWRQGSGRP